MDPSDPRYPRPKLNGTLGDAPAELFGTPPGLLGAPEREEYLRMHPEGYPAMPEPPAFPEGMAPEKVRQHVLLWLNTLRCAMEDRFTLDMLARVTMSWKRQVWTPTAQQPWNGTPFRAVPIGGTATVTVPSGGVFTNVVSGQVPLGYYGTLKQIGQDMAGTTDSWSSLSWRIAVGTASTPTGPIGGSTTYFPFAYQLGQIEAPTPLMALLVAEGNYFALQAANASLAGIDVIGRLEGYMWPRTGGVSDGSAGQMVT